MVSAVKAHQIMLVPKHLGLHKYTPELFKEELLGLSMKLQLKSNVYYSDKKKKNHRFSLGIF